MKIAIALAPQWSIMTPPLALAILDSYIDNRHDKKVFDLNIQSAHHLNETQGTNYWDVVGHVPFQNERLFNSEMLPMLTPVFDDFIQEVKDYDVITFTLYVANKLSTWYLMKEIRKLNPNVKFVVGGPASWYDSTSLFEESDYNIDVLCSGEAENIVDELMTAIEQKTNLEDVDGIYVRDGKKFKKTAFRFPIKNLNELSEGKFDNFDLAKYTLVDYLYPGEPILPIQGSRGCVAKCTFCGETRIYRFKRGEKIADEIINLHKRYGVRNFHFVDSLVNGSKNNFDGLVNKINEIGLGGKIQIAGYSRVNYMNEDRAQRASESGFRWLDFGVESGTPKVLALMEKGATVEDNELALHSCNKADLGTNVNWITGYPQENVIDWAISLFFLWRNRWNIATISGNQYPAGVLQGNALDVYRERFDIKGPSYADKSFFMNDWFSSTLDNTFINRIVRLKLTHTFMDLLKFYWSGWYEMRNVYNFKIKDIENKPDFQHPMDFESYDNLNHLGYWWELKRTHQGYSDLEEYKKLIVPTFELPDLKCKYLEEENKNAEPVDRFTILADRVRYQVRKEMRTFCYVLYKVFGGCEFDIKWKEDFAMTGAEGVEFNVSMEFDCEEDGTYTLNIQNDLVCENSGPRFRRTMNPKLRWNVNIATRRNRDFRVNNRDLFYPMEFQDIYSEIGNMNEKGDYDSPDLNCYDAFDIEKYKTNLKRTWMTGVH